MTADGRESVTCSPSQLLAQATYQWITSFIDDSDAGEEAAGDSAAISALSRLTVPCWLQVALWRALLAARLGVRRAAAGSTGTRPSTLETWHAPVDAKGRTERRVSAEEQRAAGLDGRRTFTSFAQLLRERNLIVSNDEDHILRFIHCWGRHVQIIYK
jgi:hypothetical protein